MHPPIAPRSFAPVLDVAYRLLRRAVRWEIRDPHRVLEDAAGPLVFGCRHGQLLPLLWAMQDRRLTVLVSRSGDGDLLSEILRRRGFGVIRGSTTTAGFHAAREALRVLRGGAWLGLAVDGPRGPRGTVHPGVLRLARHAGARIVPLWATGGHPYVAPGSWDLFEVPRPGSPLVVHVGAPIEVPHDVTLAGPRVATALGGRWQSPTEPLPAPHPSYGHS